MATRDQSRARSVARRADGPDGVDQAVAAYEPSAQVRALLASKGVPLTPPPERTGAHSVEWQGRAFILPAEPEPMGLRESADVLNRKADEEEQEITVSEVIDALPWDGAQAFALAVEDLFGWGIWQPQRMMWMKIPPTMRTIKTGPRPEDKKQVFWGQIYIPQLDATLNTGVGQKDGKTVFSINGSIAKKDRFRIEALIALANIYATERSIYKGKAFRMFVDEKGRIDDEKEPEFIKLNGALAEDLIFSDDVRAQIDTNLFAPILFPEACRAQKIPLKRGILLEGPYGVGKSMTAAVTASMAVENGWTFIMLDRVAGLKPILDFAHRYAPVVVFAEDIDRIISGKDRTVSIDDVLNTLDGVQGKHHEIITVLTTNHADKINRALLRPGRLDAIVSVTPPDAKAAERLFRLYGRGLIEPDADLSRAGEAIAGHIPAVIREVVERAKLSAIFRTKGDPKTLVDDDLVVAATTMKSHLDLMRGPINQEQSPAQKLGQALEDIIHDAGVKAVEDKAGLILTGMGQLGERFSVDIKTK